MVNLNFDANDVEPNGGGFDPLPARKYVAVITESKMKPTKSGTGKYLELTFEIIEGEFSGRKLWARLNLQNPNRQAVEIAQGDLSAICRAVGVMQPQDSEDLHNLPLTINVSQKRRADNGEITNEVKGYSKRDQAQGNHRPPQDDYDYSSGSDSIF